MISELSHLEAVLQEFLCVSYFLHVLYHNSASPAIEICPHLVTASKLLAQLQADALVSKELAVNVTLTNIWYPVEMLS